jgi:predicted Zn-dependent peptidase
VKSFIALALALAFVAPASANPPKLAPFPPLEFHPPKGVRVALANGMLLYLLEDHSVPLIRASALIRTGGVYDPEGKIGLADLAGRTMRSGGSQKYPADKMNELLEHLAASVETGMGLESGSAGFSCLSKDLDQTLDVFADVLLHPAFEKEKVEVERNKFLEALRRRDDDPREIARRESRRMLFGAGSPWGWRAEASTVKAVTIEDLKAFHAKYYRPSTISVAVAGDFDADTLIAKFKKAFGESPSAEAKKLEAPPAPPGPAARKVYLVDKPITQAAVRMVQFGFPRHDPDHFAYEVMNDILGGNPFISRLFSEVRSRQGLAYYAGSGFSEWTDTGMIMAAAGTKNETVVTTVSAIEKQIERMKNAPVTPEELKVAEDSIANSFVFNFTTPSQIISQRMSLDYYGYPADWLETYISKIRAVTAADVQRVAQRRLTPDSMLIYVVGDPKAFEKPLDEFGTVTKLKAEGAL